MHETKFLNNSASNLSSSPILVCYVLQSVHPSLHFLQEGKFFYNDVSNYSGSKSVLCRLSMPSLEPFRLTSRQILHQWCFQSVKFSDNRFVVLQFVHSSLHFLQEGKLFYNDVFNQSGSKSVLFRLRIPSLEPSRLTGREILQQWCLQSVKFSDPRVFCPAIWAFGFIRGSIFFNNDDSNLSSSLTFFLGEAKNLGIFVCCPANCYIEPLVVGRKFFIWYYYQVLKGLWEVQP